MSYNSIDRYPPVLAPRSRLRSVRRFLADGIPFLKNTHASAAVEFAILLPFMVVLLAGIAEFGRALWDHEALTKSVRDSARYLARVEDPSSATAQTTAKNIALRGEYDASSNSSLPYVVSYWDNSDTFSINISTVSNNDGSGNKIFRGPSTIEIITVKASVTAPTSEFPLLSLLNGVSGISFSALHQERHIGD